MKDYSKFIQSSYGFITRYEIVGDEIHIYTAETEKGEPQKMVATKENVAMVEERLENQYRMLLNNKDAIKEETFKKVRTGLLKGFGIGFGVVLIATVIMWIMNLVFPAIFVAIAALLGGAGLGAHILAQMDAKFESEMKAFKTYLEDRKSIEERSKSDDNITSYLSKKAQNKLTANNKLKKNGIITDTLNIDFMDKSDLEDLKKLISRYLISVSLGEKQYFVNPTDNDVNTNNKPKKRTKRL